MPGNILLRIKASISRAPETIKYITQYRLEYPDNPYDHELHLILLHLKNNNFDEARRILNSI
jgi:hypothetical protein